MTRTAKSTWTRPISWMVRACIVDPDASLDALSPGVTICCPCAAALFELADVWTSSTDPAEYVAFLDRLLNKVTRGGAVGMEFATLAELKAGSGQPVEFDEYMRKAKRSSLEVRAPVATPCRPNPHG